jgi:hypothetical protein
VGLGAGFGVDLQVVAELGDKLDAVSARMGSLERQLRRNQIMAGHPASAVSTLTSVAANTPSVPGALQNIGGAGNGPSPGMVWEVRRITFAPPPGGTQNGGTIIVYRGAVEIARTPTVPNFLTFSGYELIVQPNEDLLAIWYAPIVGGQLVVDVSALEYPQLSPSQLVE